MTDEKPLPIEPELVAEFVLKAHGDLGVVKQLLEQEPAIVDASWDWGGGDWETALGAAPSLREARGPHGIPLISHAEAGGEQARAVLDLLGSAAVA